MTRIRKCCVKNCDDIISKRHRFPKHDESLMEKWIKNIDHPRFSTISKDVIYNTYVVCGKHFSPECSVPGTKRGLVVDAVPTLHLGKTEMDDNEIIIQEESNSYPLQGTSLHIPVMSTPNETGGPVATEIIIEDGRKCNVQNTNLGRPVMSTPRKTDSTSSVARTSTVTRKSLLSEVDVTRQDHLTPKARHFYRKYAERATRLAAVQRRQRNFMKRLKAAEKFSSTKSFQTIMDSVNAETYNFIMAQIRTQSLPPKCRRFTLRDKIFALSLHKASPKGYRFLQKVFALPSKTTLLNLLSQIEMKTGINKQMFDNLKTTVMDMKPKEKFCVLLYDELHLSPSLQFDRKTDSICGMEDCGDRKPKICTYANVFMLKGIYKLWKQPVAFHFSSGPASSIQIKACLKEVIGQCQAIGLHVIGTVCDQATNNEAAINALKKETDHNCKRNGVENRYFGFLVNGVEIIPFYDTPHLFKGLRNNLLTKDLHFCMEDGKRKVGKWKHIVQFYYLDSSDNTRMCTKLTDGHVLGEKMNKMKVSHCTQTLSHQVGSLMMRIAKWNIQGEHTLDSEAVETAELILFLDELFDSLNGSSVKAPNTKPLKGACTKNSKHEEFWGKAISLMLKWKFYCHKRKKFIIVPSLQNTIHTMRAFLYLKKRLLAEGFDYFLPRVFNQDALENFFGAVRNHSATNCNPNSQHFVSSVKTLLINNLFSHHSPSSNCEPDKTAGALNTLRSLLSKNSVTSSSADTDDILKQQYDFEVLPKELLVRKRGRVESCTITYIAGYVARKLKKYADSCSACKSNIFYRSTDKDLDFVEARQYRLSNLTSPGEFFTYIVGRALGHIFYALPRGCHKFGIRKILISVLKRNIDFRPITCSQHPDMIDSFLLHITTCAMYFWCREVNLILSGQGSKFSRFLRSKPNIKLVDPIKLQAWNMYVKKVQKRRKGHVY